MKFLISIIISLTISFSLFAQTANNLFHIGAHQYLDGSLQKAFDSVSRGLLQEPNNTDLQLLLKIIEEEMKEQNDQQQKENDKKDDEKKKDKQDEQKQDEKQKSQEQKLKEQKKEDAEKMLKALLQKEKEEMKKEREKMNVDRTKTGKYW